MRQRPDPLRQDRIRVIEKPFGWIPFRVLTSGMLGQLSIPGKLLFFFLCLVADRQGVSFYGPRRIFEALGISPSDLTRAIDELREADLLAFDGQVYQLLSLPPWLRLDSGRGETEPTHTRQCTARDSPQHIGQVLNDIVGGR
jgi:hypothetical protein